MATTIQTTTLSKAIHRTETVSRFTKNGKPRMQVIQSNTTTKCGGGAQTATKVEASMSVTNPKITANGKTQSKTAEDYTPTKNDWLGSWLEKSGLRG